MDELRPHRVADGVFELRAGGVTVTFLLSDALLSRVEPSALDQLRATVALPGLERVVVTPDVHTGYAVPIGVTLVSASHLYPDTVGPDPACSVSLTRIDGHHFERLGKPARRAILNDLARVVVVDRRRGRTRYGPAMSIDELMEVVHGNHRSDRTWVASHPPLPAWAPAEVVAELEALLRAVVTPVMLRQVGSIGGGNHFLEVQIGDDGALYLMAHFGSRGLGAAGSRELFARIRSTMADQSGTSTDTGALMHVPAADPVGQLYFAFQHAMLEYASYNHVRVQAAAAGVLLDHLPGAEATFLGHIPHNFIERRDARYWQRKGATPAYDVAGIPLLIPGSMSTTSYVLAPGPNATRYGESVPHGAGRVLSRGDARRSLDQSEMDALFDARGVMANFRHVPLDESQAAYKDVDEVIDAVVVPGVARVVQRLRPVLVLKGE